MLNVLSKSKPLRYSVLAAILYGGWTPILHLFVPDPIRWALFFNLYLVLVGQSIWRGYINTHPDTSHRRFFLHLALFLGVGSVAINFYPWSGVIGMILISFVVYRKYTGVSGPIHLRGSLVATYHEAVQVYREALKKSGDDRSVYWGGVNVPLKDATTNFLIAGTVGSGKTVTLRFLMQSVFPAIGKPGSPFRALVYDPKVEMYPILLGMGVKPEDIIILNPFDARCAAWDIARDITTPTEAEMLANLLVPQDKSSNNDEFWRNATIVAIKAAARFFAQTVGPHWTFRDLLLALRDEKVLRAMMAADGSLKHYEQVFGSDKTSQNIMSNIITKMERYEPIAAQWEQAPTKISLYDWLNSSKILLIGKRDSAKAQMIAINQVLFTCIAQLLQDQPERKTAETFIILDELGSLGDLSMITELATEGRSKGISLAVGFQSYQHLVENYGQHLADAIAGQFNHKMILRLKDQATAKWASELAGQQQGIRYTQSETRNFNEGGSVSTQEQYFTEDAVMPSEFLSIHAFDPKAGYGMRGFCMSRVNYWVNFRHNIIESLKPEADVPAFVSMPRESQWLKPWTPEDLERLHLRYLLESEGEIVDIEAQKPSQAQNLDTAKQPDIHQTLAELQADLRKLQEE